MGHTLGEMESPEDTQRYMERAAETKAWRDMGFKHVGERTPLLECPGCNCVVPERSWREHECHVIGPYLR